MVYLKKFWEWLTTPTDVIKSIRLLKNEWKNLRKGIHLQVKDYGDTNEDRVLNRYI